MILCSSGYPFGRTLVCGIKYGPRTLVRRDTPNFLLVLGFLCLLRLKIRAGFRA